MSLGMMMVIVPVTAVLAIFVILFAIGDFHNARPKQRRDGLGTRRRAF